MAGLSVLQLHPVLNLIDTWPLQPRLQMLEHSTLVNRLHVLAPMEKPRCLLDADAVGGPLRALRDGGAHSACESLESPGAASGAHNRGEAVGRREGDRGYQSEYKGEKVGEDGGEESDEWKSVSDDIGASSVSYTGDNVLKNLQGATYGGAHPTLCIASDCRFQVYLRPPNKKTTCAWDTTLYNEEKICKSGRIMCR